MNNRFQTVQRAGLSVKNTVLKNTLILLSLTFLFSSITAYLSTVTQALPLNPLLTMIIYFGLIYGIQINRNNGLGIGLVFALTGFLGYTLGPLLNLYLHAFSNGAAIISTAFFGTACIFGGLSAYALTTEKDMNYLAGFLTVGTLTVFVLSLLNVFFLRLPMMDLFVSAGILLLSSGWILFELSAIIQGGQTNYVLATVSIFVQLFNIFVSLLRILATLSNNRDR